MSTVSAFNGYAERGCHWQQLINQKNFEHTFKNVVDGSKGSEQKLRRVSINKSEHGMTCSIPCSCCPLMLSFCYGYQAATKFVPVLFTASYQDEDSAHHEEKHSPFPSLRHSCAVYTVVSSGFDAGYFPYLLRA